MNSYSSKFAGKTNNIHFVVATDMTGRKACYFVKVEPLKEPFFAKAMKSKHINFDDFGTLVASCYGEYPTEAVKQKLKIEYNFDVEALSE